MSSLNYICYKMRHTFRFLLLATLTVCAACAEAPKEGIGEESSQDVFTIPYRTAEPDSGRIITAEVWKGVPVEKVFSAPWTDDRRDATEFQCYLSPHYFYFKFQVPDETITLQEPFLKKLDVCNEDRAEIFLSATPGMETYYSMEIDPAGRTLDYVTHYYRQFDYDWAFETLQTETSIEAARYTVAGRLSTAEMQQIGIPTDKFYMGVFRADFDGLEHVVWYSLLRVEREKADFHLPEMLFPVRVEQPRLTQP